MSPRVAVVGGGIGGVAAGLELAERGLEVVLLERGPNLGGLVVSFEIGGTPLEVFYHHVFPHERHIQGLIQRLGLGDRLEWHHNDMGVFADGRIWPFTSPLDLLRFGPLPFLDRVRTGMGALLLSRARDWRALDQVPALDWLRRYTGERATERIWRPLLRAKFGPAAEDVPAAWMWGRFDQRSGSRERGGERLGYLRGGFRQLFDAAAAELDRLGADVRTDTEVTSIPVTDGRVQGVDTSDGQLEADAVLFAGALPQLPALVEPEHHDPRWTATPGLGVLCVVLEMAGPVSGTYWTNVCDLQLPFGGVIEHTAMIPPEDYGRHVLYVSRYFTHDEPIAGVGPAAEADRWIGLLDEVWPGFRREDVLQVHPFRTPYAAPLVTVGHLNRLVPVVSHLDGLFVQTTAQIYPQDRGMSEGVRTGIGAAALIDDRLAARAPA
ncbi:MAG TPA: NAD(P)/FAD-dependent oxidoreductase [Nitriliruptorales bacterium]